MQLLAGLQIELVDHPGDGNRRRRTQGLGHRPQRVFAVRRLDQDQAGRIEAERVETVSGKTAMVALPIGRQNEDKWGRGGNMGKERHDEAERRRERPFGCGYDLMQRGGGQAAFRQMGIDGGKTEGQDFVQTVLA